MPHRDPLKTDNQICFASADGQYLRFFKTPGEPVHVEMRAEGRATLLESMYTFDEAEYVQLLDWLKTKAAELATDNHKEELKNMTTINQAIKVSSILDELIKQGWTLLPMSEINDRARTLAALVEKINESTHRVHLLESTLKETEVDRDGWKKQSEAHYNDYARAKAERDALMQEKERMRAEELRLFKELGKANALSRESDAKLDAANARVAELKRDKVSLSAALAATQHEQRCTASERDAATPIKETEELRESYDLLSQDYAGSKADVQGLTTQNKALSLLLRRWRSEWIKQKPTRTAIFDTRLVSDTDAYFATYRVDVLHQESDEAEARAHERTKIANYLEHVSRVEVGSMLSHSGREIVEWCASWVRNKLDEKWLAETAKVNSNE